jgi:hypothetical protein
MPADAGRNDIVNDKQKLELMNAMKSRAQQLGEGLRLAMPRGISHALLLFDADQGLVVLESSARPEDVVVALRAAAAQMSEGVPEHGLVDPRH